MLRPLGFGGGGAVFLLLLYLLYSCYVLKISHKFDAENTTEPVSARNQSEVLSENTAEPVSTGTQSEVPVEAAPPAEAYSIEPLVSNTTLGFGGILAVNLPSRTDRRDVLTLTAAHTDIDIQWIDGVKGEDLSQKGIPLHWDTGKHTMGILGSWRSHLNALRRVIDEGWETALIIEDDIDWDLNIKSQMQLLATKTRALANARHDPSTQITDNTPTTNPYGHEWDMLWIGACANPPGPPDSELFPGENGSQAHWVYYAHGGLCCNWAYAVTRASAKSLLVWLQDLDEPTDFAMSRWCGLNDCIVVWPELFGSFTPPGGRRRGSDNDPNRAEEKEDLEKGSTRNIVNSATVDLFEKLGHKGPWSGP